eukprot:SM000364S13662  [mRNA]  locus=s364:59070:63877:+ [translate_table: standard]
MAPQLFPLAAAGGPAAPAGRVLAETRCVRGCCRSDRLPLDVPKDSIKTGREIGKGAESIVYQGTYAGCQVAIKRPKLTTSEDIDNLHKELKLISHLQHPHIATLVAARAYPPDYSIVYELYEHGNLFNALHVREWQPTAQDVLRISLEVASAILYLHRQGIVHRDVKTANILLDKDWGAHLTDFGLAAYTKMLSKHTALNWKGSGKPTGGFHKKNMVGTLIYMPTEVLKKELHTTKSDVYSFGILVNELATGIVPYSDRTTAEQAHTVIEMNYNEQSLTAAITGEGLRPVLVGPQNFGPQILESLIKRCWHADPDKRPGFEEIIDELKRVQLSVEEDIADFELRSTAVAAETAGSLNGAAYPSVREEVNWSHQAEKLHTEVASSHGRTKTREAHSSTLQHLFGKADYLPVLSSDVFATQGARDTMEDRSFVCEMLGGVDNLHVFGVFDGHRGFEAAEYAAAGIPSRLLQNLATLRYSLSHVADCTAQFDQKVVCALGSPQEALCATFMETDSALQAEMVEQRKFMKGGGITWHPGCTAATVLILQDHIFVANAGDCRTILCRDGKAVALSRDHTASDPRERARIERAGDRVTWRVNTWRVGDAAIEVINQNSVDVFELMCQVARSIGDDDLKPAVTAVPEVMEHLLTSADEFMVMASDGLWETLSNEEVVNFVYDTVKEPAMCGKRLATEAVNRGSKDNITVIVVYLRPVTTFERVY